MKRFYTSKWCIIAIIAFGILCRLSRYIANHSLHNDEASLVVQIIDKDFSELAKPLWGNAAPRGFLYAEKFVINTFGYSEYALRLLPLIAGIASLILFYFLAWRFIGRNFLPIALFLFATSSTLIVDSTIPKQYMVDVLLALILYLLALTEEENWGVLRIIALTLAGAIAIWLSFVAIFVVASAGMVLCVDALLKRRYLRSIQLVFICLIWFECFLYFVPINEMKRNPVIAEWWGGMDVFMPLPPTSLKDLWWFVATFFKFVMECIDENQSGYTVLLFAPAGVALIMGLVAFLGGKKRLFWFNIILAASILFVSGFRKYPISVRHELFVTPLVFIAIAKGVEWLSIKKATKPFLYIALAVVIMLPPAVKSIHHLLLSRNDGEIRDAIAYMYKHNEVKADAVFVIFKSDWQFDYYSRSRSHEKISRLIFFNFEDVQTKVSNLLNSGDQKIWFIFDLDSKEQISKKNAVLDYLNENGVSQESYETKYACAYLYNLKGR